MLKILIRAFSFSFQMGELKGDQNLQDELKFTLPQSTARAPLTSYRYFWFLLETLQELIAKNDSHFLPSQQCYFFQSKHL